jgi:hypothetical protein
MTWGRLRKYVVDACGESTAIVNEVYEHLTEGLRRVCSLVDVPELVVTATSTITADTDYIEKPAAAYHILTIVNLTDEYNLHPEPGGMLGRARYLVSTGKPPSGSVTHFFPDGSRIYFRDTPSVETSIQLRYRTEPAAITEADIDLSPVTPERYDWGIIHASVRNYYQVHPDLNVAPEGTHMTLADKAERALQAVLGEPRPDYAEVNKGAYHVMRLSGYNMSPRRR